jgi:surface antigen
MLPFLGSTECRAFVVLLALLLSVSIADAGTTIPIPQGMPWSGLSRDDLNRMHAAAARLYEGRSIGTIERWRNPDSNDAGEVKLLRQFEAKGMPCSQIEYTIRLAGTQELRRYALSWCKLSTGDWKIVDVAPHN